jgi:hypothetical protein
MDGPVERLSFSVVQVQVGTPMDSASVDTGQADCGRLVPNKVYLLLVRSAGKRILPNPITGL